MLYIMWRINERTLYVYIYNNMYLIKHKIIKNIYNNFYNSSKKKMMKK